MKTLLNFKALFYILKANRKLSRLCLKQVSDTIRQLVESSSRV